jgi:hypothetical protein
LETKYIKLKTDAKESVQKVILTFESIQKTQEKVTGIFDEFLSKNVKKGKNESALGYAISFLLHSQQMFTELHKDALLHENNIMEKIVQNVEIMTQLTEMIGQLTEITLKLSKQSTNKELTNKVIKDLVTLQDRIQNVTKTQNDQSVKIADARSDIEDFVKAQDRFFENSSKQLKKDGEENERD